MDDKRTNKIISAWRPWAESVQGKGFEVQQEDLNLLMAQIFCPGPFYFYIMDFASYEFIYVHSTIKEVLGLQVNQIKLNELAQFLHPDDVDHFVRCEELSSIFLYKHLQSDQVKNYKISYCFRMLHADGTYKLILHQAVTHSLSETGVIRTALGVHCDISHLVSYNNHKISFQGIGNVPSYLGLDVNQPFNNFSDFLTPKLGIKVSLSSILTPRQREIMKEIADGGKAKDICGKLYISYNTYRTHCQNIRKRLKVNTIGEAVRKAMDLGMFS